MKRLLCVIFILAFIVSCNGGSSTSPNTGNYTQGDLTGTWLETVSERRMNFDATGEVTNVASGTDQVFGFSGNIQVSNSEGNISGKILINHAHSETPTAHEHYINYTGSFSSKTEINVDWNIVDAGSGSTIWVKIG